MAFFFLFVFKLFSSTQARKEKKFCFPSFRIFLSSYHNWLPITFKLIPDSTASFISSPPPPRLTRNLTQPFTTPLLDTSIRPANTSSQRQPVSTPLLFFYFYSFTSLAIAFIISSFVFSFAHSILSHPLSFYAGGMKDGRTGAG